MATTIQHRPHWPGRHHDDDPEVVEERRVVDTDRTDGVVADDRVVERRPSRVATVGHTVRVMLATLLLAAVVLFAAANTTELKVDFLFDSVRAPMWAVIAGSGGAGMLVGMLLVAGRRRRRV
jgi:uncharacterized integral membrane protein